MWCVLQNSSVDANNQFSVGNVTTPRHSTIPTSISTESVSSNTAATPTTTAVNTHDVTAARTTTDVTMPCHEECAEGGGCTGPYAGDCERCKHYRLMPGAICVRHCPGESYADHVTRTCHMCDRPCARCTISEVISSGDVSTPEVVVSCVTCVPGFMLIEEQGHCVSSCPLGFYEYQGEFCKTVCSTCTCSCISYKDCKYASTSSLIMSTNSICSDVNW